MPSSQKSAAEILGTFSLGSGFADPLKEESRRSRARRAEAVLKALKESAAAGLEMGETAGEAGRRGAVAGGKQGWRVRDDSRQSSAHVFDTHRRDELQVRSASF